PTATADRSEGTAEPAANGFAQVLYEPTAAACHQAPYTFRPVLDLERAHTGSLGCAQLQRRVLSHLLDRDRGRQPERSAALRVAPRRRLDPGKRRTPSTATPARSSGPCSSASTRARTRPSG